MYILGGYQTDFAKNWNRLDLAVFDMLKEAVEGALANADISPLEIDTAHIGNFAGELFNKQAQLGGLFAAIHPDFAGIPTSRHEAACASGSMAVLAASAEIEAGRYDIACIIGIEEMKNVPARKAAEYLGSACWLGKEAVNATYPWPYLFSEIAEEYDKRYGLSNVHLAELAKKNLYNAQSNPNAQTRNWKLDKENFLEDEQQNPVIEGRLRQIDCGRITDGAACIILASEAYAIEYAKRKDIRLSTIPKIKGWGHRTATMLLKDKMQESSDSPYVFPHVRRTILDALFRSNIKSIDELDVIETHDCFTISEYLAIDHFGLTAPGRSYEAIESGMIAKDGKLPINPSGGLIGAGHPVGATGVRMLLDAYKQVTNTAGDYQIEGSKNVATLNIGGSTTTSASFVVGV
ncbi:acetyl-CoA acetyltransferase [Cytobacillus sp. IB215316]|uniref:acetyl-CoA acetyltransferase n=1 Tax=Cytobacillus sp. IB215316 TaxID=3097354 RepID=UPI002A14112D|nr:acetyl-CoA acetyltransferase [Cytobacillus sp. IB215316]MDX8360404.1 acetyl-CoA acetyltransferase [Cytobacillus sp. IB215316]